MSVPLRPLPGSSLEQLIREHLTATEDASTLALIQLVRPALERGYMTVGEFRAVCRWKSPRSAGHVERNNHHRVRAATGTAIRKAKDRDRIEPLLTLRGVSVPTASAVLTMIDPERYGVIDIRVWQLLHRLRLVEGAPAGTGLTVVHWERFLEVIRRYAGEFRVTARAVELALFHVHREYQEGTLYRVAGKRP
jgi:hypothetical protein